MKRLWASSNLLNVCGWSAIELGRDCDHRVRIVIVIVDGWRVHVARIGRIVVVVRRRFVIVTMQYVLLLMVTRSATDTIIITSVAAVVVMLVLVLVLVVLQRVMVNAGAVIGLQTDYGRRSVTVVCDVLVRCRLVVHKGRRRGCCALSRMANHARHQLSRGDAGRPVRRRRVLNWARGHWRRDPRGRAFLFHYCKANTFLTRIIIYYTNNLYFFLDENLKVITKIGTKLFDFRQTINSINKIYIGRYRQHSKRCEKQFFIMYLLFLLLNFHV